MRAGPRNRPAGVSRIPNVPIDTNHLEREIRPIALGRKNWLFCWTEVGAECVGDVQSLLATGLLQEVDPYTYLVDVLQRIDDHPFTDVATLTSGCGRNTSPATRSGQPSTATSRTPVLEAWQPAAQIQEPYRVGKAAKTLNETDTTVLCNSTIGPQIKNAGADRSRISFKPATINGLACSRQAPLYIGCAGDARTPPSVLVRSRRGF